MSTVDDARSALEDVIDGHPFAGIDDGWRGLRFAADNGRVDVVCKHGTKVVAWLTNPRPIEHACRSCDIECCGPCTRGERCTDHPEVQPWR